VQETDAGSQYTELVLPRNASNPISSAAQPELEQHSQLPELPFPRTPFRVGEHSFFFFKAYRGML